MPYYRKRLVKGTTILLVILLSFVITTPLATLALAQSRTEEDPTNWLFVSRANQSQYQFTASGPSYILVDIVGTDFARFSLDGENFTASYGYNAYSKTFLDSPGIHMIEIDPGAIPFFKTITVEPVFLYQGVVNTTLDAATSIQFWGAGPISILTQPEFAYNWLYLQLDDVLIKKIYDTTTYPEVDSALYAAIVEEGSYMRDDIRIDPGLHTLQVKGNGSLNIVILVNEDFDSDQISSPDEMNWKDSCGLNPIVPDIWGFFQKSSKHSIYSKQSVDGYFSFFIPTSNSPINPTNFFFIDVYGGEFSNFILDGDSLLLDGVTLAADYPSTPPVTQFVTNISSGWHNLEYIVNSRFNYGLDTDISFRINTNPIKIVDIQAMKDSDGDGIKDFSERSSGLDSHNTDSDIDGLPDNLDSSPQSNLTLEQGTITQLVIPTDPQRDTLFSLYVKKPAMDYSTEGTSRLWRDTISVNISLALRLFGNSSITRADLANTWGKSVDSYSLVSSYNASGGGDDLPGQDPNNEFTFIFPKPANKSWEYDISFAKTDNAKSGGVLDLRFDFVWVVSHDSSILHFYDPEEDLLVQAIATREFGSIYYILGKPASWVENQALWALVQNPELGSPSEFGLQDRIVGGGGVRTAEYFSLADDVFQLRAANPREPADSEVLYIAGQIQNLDVLNKIRLKSVADPSFDELHAGDVGTFFTYYVISDLYNGQYNIGDPQIQGEEKTDYTSSWQEHMGIAEQKVNVADLPVNMEFINLPATQILVLATAHGYNIPLLSVPTALTGLHDNLRLSYQTFIEPRESPDEQVPTVNFNASRDLFKEFEDNRQREVNLNDIFWQEHSPSYADMLASYLADLLDEIQVLRECSRTLIGLAYYESGLNNLDTSMLRSMDNQILKIQVDIDAASNVFFSDTSYGSKAKSIDNLMKKTNQMFEAADIFETEFNDVFISEPAKTRAREQLKLMEQTGDDLQRTTEQYGKVLQKLEKQKIFIQRLKIAIGGVVAAAIGIVCFIAGLSELTKLVADRAAGIYDDRVVEFGFRLAGALALTALGALSVTLGVLLILSSLSYNLACTFANAIQALGSAIQILGIIVAVFKIGEVIARALNGDISTSELAFTVLNTLLVLGFSTVLPLLIGLASSYVGTIVAVIVAAVLFVTSLITSAVNHPNVNITSTSTIMPEENLERHASLTQGDSYTVQINLNNSGDTDMWMRMQYAVGLADPDACTWTDWQGKWSGDVDDDPSVRYIPGETDTYTFNVAITEPTPNLYYHLRTEVDADINELTLVGWERHRSTGGRSIQSIPMNVSVLDPKITDFYDDTVPIPGTNHAVPKALLKSQLEQAVREYRYKDATEIARQITALTEGTAEISAEEFLGLKDRAEPYNASYDSVQATSVPEFQDLITRFFSKGFRAKYPLPYPWITIGQYPDFRRQAITPLEQHLLAAGIGNLKILVPKTWFTQMEIELADAIAFAQLPIVDNIKLDPAKARFNVYPGDPTDTWIGLTIDGPDNPIIYSELTLPSGFTFIYPSGPIFGGYLKSPLFIRIAPTGSDILAGSYNIPLKIFLDPERTQLIFSASIPFRYIHVSDLVITTTFPPGSQNPLTPGDTFTAVSLANHGNVPELLEFEVDGLPDAFIDQETYPPGSTGNIQSFTLLPGEARPILIVSPPKILTTVPGTYSYTTILRDAGTGAIRYESAGNLFVGPYYAAELSGMNLAQTGLDSESLTYSLTLTNLGNTLETFVMSKPGLTLATGQYTPNILTLGPGEEGTVSFQARARGIGFQEFTFKATSAHQSASVPASIDIQDDDPDAPVIHNVTVTGLDGISPVTDGMEWFLVTVNTTNGYSGVASVSMYAPSLPYRNPYYTASPVGGDLYQVQVLGPRTVGNYTWAVTVTDSDADWEGDASAITAPVPVTVIDDDTEAPIIHSVEFLDATSESNNTILDGANNIRVKLHVTDYSGLSDFSLAVEGPNYHSLGVWPTPLGGDDYIAELPNPAVLGSYVLHAWVSDDDMDNYWNGYYDRSSTTWDVNFTIADDDTLPPVFTGVDFLGHNLDTDPYVWMQVQVSDQDSGVGSVSVDFNGGRYYALQQASSLNFIALLQTPDDPGTYVATVVAWDADQDRPGDQLAATQDMPVTIINTAPKVNVYYTNNTLGVIFEYPATGTFSAQDAGTFPEGWFFDPLVPPAGAWELLTAYQGHATVLQLNKQVGEDHIIVGQELAGEVPNGTLEFWALQEGAGSQGTVFFGDASRAVLEFDATDLAFVNTDAQPTIIAQLSPGWHHYRLDFAGEGIQESLGPNQLRVILDGVMLGTYDLGEPLHFQRFGFMVASLSSADPLATGGSLFLDAVGMSWDPNYYIGLNRRPSLLGVDLTRENYPVEYDATYTFSSDSPTGDWGILYEGQVSPLQPRNILSAYLGHQSVLTLSASVDPTTAQPIFAFCPFTQPQVAGTIELWMALEGDTSSFAIEGAAVNGQWTFLAGVIGGALLVPAGQDNYNVLRPFNMGEWHHLRVDFAGPGQTYLGLESNQYRLILDQVDVGTFTAAVNLTISALMMGAGNQAGTSIGQAYVDAVGFSWDPSYTIGQNLLGNEVPETPILTITTGEPDAMLTWMPKDLNFGATHYDLYVDGTLSANGSWTFENKISQDLSGLLPGEHLLSAVFNDGIGGITTSSIIVYVVGPQEELSAEIDTIITAIQASSNADWRCPASCRKGAMIEKLEEVKDLIAAGRYAEAYEKLLRDIKPKLTGLKTDENETAWGNGVERKQWVTSPALQEAFKDQLNPVLRGVKALADGTPSPPCHGHHGPHHEHGHHCGSHHGHAHGGPNQGHGNHCGSGNHPGCHAC